jgi:uncharacterized protein (TIGR03086 family)
MKSTPADVTTRYVARADRFEAVIQAAPAERWTSPSPCDDWRAIDVVQHVLDMHAAMLRPLERPLTDAPAVDVDPLSAFRSARRDLMEILADDEVARSDVPTPVGTRTLAEHIDQVASADLVIHGWDLARATGQEHQLDPEEVERMWPEAQEMDERMRTPGAFGPGIVVFGPVVDVPADAPISDRLLGLLGRDPYWVAG